MLALSVQSAKNLAVVLAIGLAVIAIGSAWVVKKATAKILTIIIFGGLALGMWTQRQSLQDCAKKVRDRGVLGATSDTTCTFLGSDVKVPGISTP